ncbi:MAG: DUF4870 domain-containing protein [Kiritimatiellia bacterium]
MSLPEEIEKLEGLRERGAISQEEYEESKQAILSRNMPLSAKTVDPNVWGMFIHLSQFCGFVLPLGGIIVPIVLWQVKKEESEVIDCHGRVVMNWVISEIIYGVASGLLLLILIGLPLLITLAVLSMVFPIIGAVKANNGEVWRYPCSIPFFSLD